MFSTTQPNHDQRLAKNKLSLTKSALYLYKNPILLTRRNQLGGDDELGITIHNSGGGSSLSQFTEENSCYFYENDFSFNNQNGAIWEMDNFSGNVQQLTSIDNIFSDKNPIFGF